MIERKKPKNYSKRVRHVRGSGFMDIFRNIGSYIGQNKDIIAKPLLSATGEAAGHIIREGSKAIVNKILTKEQGSINKNNKDKIEKIMNKTLPQVNSPVENIIGSGIKKF